MRKTFKVLKSLPSSTNAGNGKEDAVCYCANAIFMNRLATFQNQITTKTTTFERFVKSFLTFYDLKCQCCVLKIHVK